MESVVGPDESSVGQWRAALALALREAMKRRDTVAVAALRSLSARIANAEAVPVDTMPRAGAIEGAALGVGAADAARKALTRDDLTALVHAELDELDGAAASLEAVHRHEMADELRSKAALIRGLPHP